MANHKSAIKRHRQSLKRRDHNRNIKATVRTEIKKAITALANGDKETALKLYHQAESSLAKAAAKGVLHKRNASRRTARLAKAIKTTK